jgi:hypothetical protein
MPPAHARPVLKRFVSLAFRNVHPAFSALVEPENVGYTPLVMQTFHAETVVEKDGRLHLDHVPFSEGEAVHVFVSSATPITKQPLQGSVLKYEQPFAPVAEEDWEAVK